MTPRVAETMFRLHDDLASSLPEADDRPSVQQWKVNERGTLNYPVDDIPLARSYAGSYSWLATIVPAASPKGSGTAIDYPANYLLPTRAEFDNAQYDVSVAVFHKRDLSDLAKSERAIAAELFLGADLVVFSTAATEAAAIEEVDNALADIRAGQWIALAGVRPNGQFLLKWYKILSLDDETDDVTVTDVANPSSTIDTKGRHLQLDGPDWPADGASSIANLRAILLPGVIGVSTQSLTMERN